MAAENGEKLTIIPIIIDLSACMGYIYTFMRSPVICAHAVYIRNRFCFFYNLVVNMHFHPACTCNNGGRCWCMVLGLLAWAKMCVLYYVECRLLGLFLCHLIPWRISCCMYVLGIMRSVNYT